MQKWSDAGLGRRSCRASPAGWAVRPLFFGFSLFPLGILSDVLATCSVKTPQLLGVWVGVDSGRWWGCPESPMAQEPCTGRLGQRDEFMLDQKTSEGFWESVPKATRQCGLRSIPHTSQQPWSACGDLLQHRKDTPKQCCSRRLRKVGSPWHSQALPLSSLPKVASRSCAEERSGRFELDGCPRRLRGWHQPAPSSGAFCSQ